ncbi:hypothetical protein RD110_15425 [Rhodoferax koreense]|uniref:DUF1772 domain-containing protein n=1 Tax=Rhodoferax koreensis TaxID=1842727 RepID=A0A1P8JXC6_9BURK|nr:anthrone oxygenase family protein [Rhodoferax koreense]APW38414.1 hypothetical protein RD110_15425 [Rhodoferax koreense]
MLSTLPLLACLGAAVVGGVFFAFSAFVMKALAQLPAHQGVAAMQRINLVVLKPLFMAIFIGTTVLSAICVLAGFYPWGTARSAWLLASGLLFFLGAFVVTGACNVPRNEKLRPMDPDSPQAAAYWPVYLREWLRWNHVRTAASLLSAACAGMALAH